MAPTALPTDKRRAVPGDGVRTVSLHAFLIRLIRWCVFPLVVLAFFLAAHHIITLKKIDDQTAANQARNVATAIDSHIEAQIAALQILASSPLVDDPARWQELYREGQGFRENFGGHVILADVSMQMLFNTRVPFGSDLPKLPRPKGHAAAPTVMATGKPAVGDMFTGPIAKATLVSIVVPVIRDNRIRFLLLSVIETRQLQQCLDKVALPAEWSLTLVDGKNEVMAHRCLPELEEKRPDPGKNPGRWVARSAVSPWSVILEIPRSTYLAPFVSASVILGLVILLVTLVSVAGGRRAGRRLAGALTALVESNPSPAAGPIIAEIEEARRILSEAAAAQQAAESTLRENERRYRQLFDITPLPLCFVDKDGVFENFNARFTQVFGYGAADLPTVTEWWGLAYPDADYRRRVIETWEAALARARQEKTDIEPIEYQVTCKNGETRTVLISGITSGDGFLAAFFDVTERNRAEKQLRYQELLLEDMGRIAKIGGWEFDPATGKGTWTDEVARIHDLEPGLETNAALGMSFYKGESLLKIEKALKEAIEFGKPYSLELELISAGGVRKWVHTIGQPTIVDGKVVHVRGSIQDITERKRAGAERERLTAAINQVSESILVADAKGTIQYVNPAFEAVTGYSSSEVIGRNPRILNSGKQNRAFYENLWKTISSGNTWVGRIINKRKDGTLYTEDVTISPVLDQTGGIVSYVAVKRDVSEQLRLEAQFQQAQKMESVGRLAGGVAHDYNNILSVILGYAELALDRVDPADPLHDDLQEIFQAAERSRDVTRQLLAFARKQTIAPKVLDLNATVEGMLKMIRRLIGEDIELGWLPGEDIWPVWMDPSQLDQILANLCVNARDAIADVGKITIETAPVTLDGAYSRDPENFVPGDFVMLAVSDNGSGMDRETLDKIFEPFFTTKEQGKGTGLGLATVYGIVKQNQGVVSVYSEPGKGTTFKIYLPRHGGLTGCGMQDKPAEIAAGRGETVLVVEDEGSILKLTERILNRLGYTVLIAKKPGEALRVAEQHKGGIHLLITDVVMPDMNGRELAARLQSLYPHLKCLFMSGYTANVIAHRGVLDKGINFIHKPFSVRDLSVTVRAMLDEKKN